MDDQEIWCDVKGYEDLYQVSNKGRVKSLGNDKSRKEKILKPQGTRLGYLQIMLCKGGERKMHQVHRLVLMTFAPCENMENLQVNHLDENKENNQLNNLEWVTCKENINHGTHNDRVAEKNTNGKCSIPIAQLTQDGKFLKAWKSSMGAEREGGFNSGAIIQCCKNKYMRDGNNIYKDYRWMYLSEFMDKHTGIVE